MTEPLLEGPTPTKTHVWQIGSDVAQADVFSVGGALHNLCFTLPGGQKVVPLAEACWHKAYLTQTGSGSARHLELLGGEWPCVPFGSTCLDPAHHGFGSNNDWTLDHHDDRHLSMSITYPQGHVINRLEREITLREGALYVDLTLRVTSNEDAVVPIGLHPILRIPRTQDWSLVPGRYEASTRPDGQACAKGIWDQPGQVSDALIQLWTTQGRFELHDVEAGTATLIEWNPKDLPHCLLWFANPGLSLGDGATRFRGLGIEPIHSAFDGCHENANSNLGVKLSAGQPWQTSYRIGCRPLASV